MFFRRDIHHTQKICLGFNIDSSHSTIMLQTLRNNQNAKCLAIYSDSSVLYI